MKDEILLKNGLKNHNELSDIVGEFMKQTNTKRDEFILEFENGETDYRKKNRKEVDKFLEKNWEDWM